VFEHVEADGGGENGPVEGILVVFFVILHARLFVFVHRLSPKSTGYIVPGQGLFHKWPWFHGDARRHGNSRREGGEQQYFVIFFTNSALVGAALIRLRGADPTVGDGMRIALRHSGAILGYALIAATVGMILRWLSERAGTIGRIVVGLVGLAWNIATYLVVPVLVVEEVGPIDGIKRSVELLKRTWGEQIVSDVSIGLIFGLLSLLVIAAGIPVIVLAANIESIGLIVAVIAVEIVILLLLGLINSTLSGIYTAAVYQYAVTGEAGGYLSPEMVQGAFRHKG
jgi:hypothetical protein